jgi:hypothetical protein
MPRAMNDDRPRLVVNFKFGNAVLYTMPSRGPTGNQRFSLILQDLGLLKSFKTEGFSLETGQSEAGFGPGIKY